MKILHLSYTDRAGGAARAAFRLHRALCEAGTDSRMAVISRTAEDETILRPLGRRGLLRNKAHQLIERQLLSRQHDPNPAMRSANLFTSGMAAWINRSDFDVVHLHWINHGTIGIEEIARLKKPVVWTLHDMWPFCGGEHYEAETGTAAGARWQCGYRPQSRLPQATGPDLDRRIFRRKLRAWRDKRFRIVGPSRWITACAQTSTLFSAMPCQTIANGIDLDVFKPLDKRIACDRLQLDPEKKYVLFGAVSAATDPRKGFALLQKAMSALVRRPEGQNAELLIFGAGRPGAPPDFGFPTHYLGTFGDDLALNLLYAAADVFAAPSRQENLANTLIEALATGTPCVAFDVGGMSDLVADGENGILARPFDAGDFAGGIARLLAGTDGRFARAARKSAEARFDARSAAGQYIALYRSCLRPQPEMLPKI